MNCPCCGNEMEQGFLQGTKRIAFVKKKHKISILPNKGEILLENNTYRDFVFTAWICKSCEKIVADYSNKNIQQG